METARKRRPPLEERLLKGLHDLEEWMQGERDDLRVTKLTIPDEEAGQPASETRPKPHKATGQ